MGLFKNVHNYTLSKPPPPPPPRQSDNSDADGKILVIQSRKHDKLIILKFNGFIKRAWSLQFLNFIVLFDPIDKSDND